MIKLHHLKEESLEKDNSFTVQVFSVQQLATEMSKFSNNVAATVIGDLLTRSHHRSKSNFVVTCMRTVHNGQNSTQIQGPHICNTMPDCIKDSETLDIFKNKIQGWKPLNCYQCRLCKKHMPKKSRFPNSDLIQCFC